MTRTLAIIGAGGWGGNWTHRSLHDSDWETLAYVDADPAVLDRLASLGVPRERLFRDANVAMDAVRTDAITCTIPNPSREPVLFRALEEGRHILVDKPLVHTPEALSKLLRDGKDRRSVFTVAQNYRFFAGTQFAKRSVDAGDIGRVGEMHVRFLRHHPSVATQFLKDLRGVLPLGLEMCIHHFDMMRFLLGTEPEAMSAHGWRSPWSAGIGYDCLAVHLVFPDGVHVAYDATWGSHHSATDWPGHWEIVGENGTLSVGYERRAWRAYRKDGEMVADNPGPDPDEDTAQSMDRVWVEFKAAVEAAEDGPVAVGLGFCPLEDNAKSLGIALAVSEAVKTGCEIDYTTFMEANGLR